MEMDGRRLESYDRERQASFRGSEKKVNDVMEIHNGAKHGHVVMQVEDDVT